MNTRHIYSSIRFGVETLPANTVRPRHRHRAGYANIVLGGSFVESSFAGRFAVEPGDVLLHGTFDCHANVPHGRNPIQILRLPWEDDGIEGHYRVRDPDHLVRLAARDPREAMNALAYEIRTVRPGEQHWTSELAVTLASGSLLSLRHWAEERGLRPDELSRGFRSEFGVPPRLFRLEARSRRAWATVVRSNWSLTRIAHDHDFSDLAHMSRSIRAFTGLPPKLWRSDYSLQVRSSQTPR
jgi:AraC-like DNA-binding protein